MTPKQLGEQPAFPSEEVALQGTPFQKVTTTQGMNTRTLIAAFALQGLLANKIITQACLQVAEDNGTSANVSAARHAVGLADALLAELSKESP